MKIAGYETHPAADIFNLLEGKDFDDLVKDIKENGQNEEVVLYQDRILDGRNRARACEKLGITPKTRVWNGRSHNGSATAFVVSANLRRRHLTPAQEAAVAAELEPLFAAEAKERQRDGQRAGGGDHRSAEYQAKPLGGEFATKRSARDPDAGKARTQAANATGANPRRVSDLKAIMKKDRDVYEAVRNGRLNVEQAKTTVAAPPKVRKQILAEAAKGKAPSATKIRERAGLPPRSKSSSSKPESAPSAPSSLMLPMPSMSPSPGPEPEPEPEEEPSAEEWNEGIAVFRVAKAIRSALAAWPPDRTLAALIEGLSKDLALVKRREVARSKA